eukprot:TRINITY_DN613_c0_g1_i1.p1 TRINITY_DN613_c0_g1~~TRINITY_DN613_c0_g1_i1.p1  ORF type:complete len:250 (+),score=49.53 TRINITY_DN613_c0_g1_i1:111-752(+)
MQSAEFQHILRILNTNIEGRHKTMFALTAIKGVGRRFSNLVLKKADVDLSKRAGMLSSEEIDRIVTIIQNPRQFKIPDWFLNRQKDFKDGKYSQLIANNLDFKLREDLDRMRKIRCHRGSPSLRWPARAWPAHEDHGAARPYGWCVKAPQPVKGRRRLDAFSVWIVRCLGTGYGNVGWWQLVRTMTGSWLQPQGGCLRDRLQVGVVGVVRGCA